MRLALLSLALLAGAGFSPLPAASGPPFAPADAVVLVRQLGADSYREREASSRQLLRIGRRAILAVRAGLADPDAEIRRRCAALLPRIDRPELEPRLAALLDGRDRFAPPLPAWDRFRALAGSDVTARWLYVELYQADRAWLELIHRDPPGAAAQLNTRVNEMQRRLYNVLPAGQPADSPRVSTADLAAIYLAAEGMTGNVSNFYLIFNLIYHPEVQGRIRGNPALSRLVGGVLSRRSGDPNLFYLSVHAARMLDLKDLLKGTLEPAALRQLDAALSQPPDLDKFSQAANMIANLEIQEQVPARARTVARALAQKVVAQPYDQRRYYLMLQVLQNLHMQEAIDEVVRPAIFQMVRTLAERKLDLNQFYQVHSLCQMIQFVDALEVLKPAACRLVIEAAAHPEDQARITQALHLARNLNLQEALEGVLRPAVRRSVLAALEQPDDLRRLSQACNLALQVNLDLVEDTLKPILHRQAKVLLDRSPNLATVREIHQLAQQLGARDTIDNLIKPALRKALLAAGEQPINQATLDQGLYLARLMQLKEGAPLAIKGALAKGLTGYTRANAVLFVATLGTPEQTRQLESLLADTTSVGSAGINGTQLHAELRDVVLGSLVHQSGQKLGDYGFSPFATFTAAPFTSSPSFFGFENGTARDKALNRWKKWCAEQKK
jgi:hypothetical protein